MFNTISLANKEILLPVLFLLRILRPKPRERDVVRISSTLIRYPLCVTSTFFSPGAINPYWVLASPFTRFVFLDHILHATVGRTNLDE